jgi:chromosome segregation ATPase
MIDQRKADIKQRITTLTEELTPLLARVKNLQERISHLELDLRDVMDSKYQRKEYRA